VRRIARVDANQAAIVAGLRAAGCSVLCLHQLGKGVPDIVVGTRRGNLFLEIKDGTKPSASRKLTPDEKAWHAAWRGPREVVSSLQGALAALVTWGLWLDQEGPRLQTSPRDP
jgi:hypothetical protein